MERTSRTGVAVRGRGGGRVGRGRRVVAVVAAALALMASACSSRENDGEFLGSEEIDVVTHKDLPGMALFGNYTYSGFDNALHLDLAKWLEGEQGVQVTRSPDVSSAARIPKLEWGDADLVIASFPITPDRMKEIDFAGPYLTTVQGFLARADSVPTTTTI